MVSLRTHVIICGALFLALIGIAILGNVLQAAGMPPPTGAARNIAVVLFFGLFVAFALSTIPVIVKVVLGAQVKAGNQNVGLIGGAIRHQNAIIYTMWGVMIAGIAVAVPAMLADGFFGAGSQHALNSSLEGQSLGTLAARPDMSLDEMVRQSTLKIDLKYARSAISGGGVFDFKIPGTKMFFPHARYYFISTYTGDSSHVRSLNVGTSPEKMPLAELAKADDELRTRLVSDGWLAGHEVYRTEEDQTLHGGAKEGPEGRTWMKDGMVLDVERNRMDDEKPGEDRATAGEWIQFIELWPAKDYSGIDRLVFQPAKSAK